MTTTSSILEPGKLYCFKEARLKMGLATHISLFRACSEKVLLPVTAGPTEDGTGRSVVWHFERIDPIEGWDKAKAAVFLYVETVMGQKGPWQKKTVPYHLFLYGDQLISFGPGDINQMPGKFLDKITKAPKR